VLVHATVTAAGTTSLIDALRDGDRAAALALLIQPLDVNEAEADGTTALHWSVHRDDPEITGILIRSGVAVNPVTDYGVTPLRLACTNANDGMVRQLLDAGADPNAALWTGETVLMECARTGTARGVGYLLERGAGVNTRENNKGQTALMWAAAGGHADAVQELLQHGADIRQTSTGGFTPLLFAARSGDVESARLLIAAGASPDESTPQHGNTLVVASAGGHEDLALYLLESGADVNVTDENGITALHHAARNGLTALNGVRYDAVYRVRPPNMQRLARALLEAGADPNVQIKKNQRLGPDGSPFEMEGATPFLLAAVSGDAALMHLLEEYEADVSINGAGGITPLMAAARAACTGSCAFLGGNRANLADIELSYQAVKAAVEMGVNINARSDEGQTAMHMAAFTGADMVVQYLADQGADVNVKDNYGETPWSMASGISPVLRYRGLYGTHASTAELLVRLGAVTTSRDAMDTDAPPPPGQ
jgi:ankyrin repeat protein